jgi:hypothetical protein
MPLVNAQLYVQSILDGLVIPGPANPGTLEALITPPDPNVETTPIAYIWPTRGEEHRQSVPRNIGPGTRAAWKEDKHSVDIYLVWFGEDTDPYSDVTFPSIMDAVLKALRESPDPASFTDPNTALQSWMVGVGEQITWETAALRSTADQRWMRYSALILCPFTEMFQA